MSKDYMTVPVSPSSPILHTEAFRLQDDFPLDASTRLVSGTNPWRPKARGWPFFEYVLRPNPVSTVGEIIRLATKHGFGYDDSMQNLRWLFTWGGSYIEIGGQLYSPPPILVEAARLPGVVVVAKKSKRKKVQV